MKKSINVTINQVVFQIEEPAYEKLDHYLDSIKEHYGSGKEGREILADIEMGISDKFAAKTRGRKQVINEADVKEVIKAMGTVTEIDGEAAEAGAGKTGAGKKRQKSGPTAQTSQKRRLYRNPDDVVIAGVCSGIATYFGIDPVWVRLASVLLVFISGTGILIYLLLWLIMPKAETNTQKLEMQGKPVNLAEIQGVVKEKSAMLKDEGREAVKNLKKKQGGLYKVLNFPIQVLERIIEVLKKILGALGPVLSVIIGVALLIGAAASILGLSIAAGLALFGINLDYIVSDLPLEEITGSLYYYLGVSSVYLIALVPMIFLLILGMTMTRRKNAFRLLSSSLLLAIWMAAIVGAVIAGGRLAPEAAARVAEKAKRDQTSVSYDYRDFNKLYLGGYTRTKIVEGDGFSISLNGRQQDIDRLEARIENGQLQITQKERHHENRICLFCADDAVDIEIVMPRLDSLVGVNRARIELAGFTDDLYVSLGESARANLELSGQHLNCSLAGVDSELNLTGRVEDLDCESLGSAKLVARELLAKNITLKQQVFSKAQLDGETDNLRVALSGASKLYGFDMKAENAVIQAADHSLAQIQVKNNLTAKSEDQGRIVYEEEPREANKKIFEQGVIEVREREEDGI